VSTVADAARALGMVVAPFRPGARVR
jgi:hypothetical protein